ncbi:hypothetical protein ACQP2X_17240 [Actinoplanes sp. CA-131856]
MLKTGRRAGFLATTLFAIGAVLAFTATPALAVQPGEDATWAPEIENDTALRAGDTISEARDLNNGNLMQVWRGYGNSNIYIAINHSVPLQLPSTTTYAAPRVVWTNDGFFVFHTGTDGYIYYRRIPVPANADNVSGNWTRVPNNARTENTLSPSVTRLNGNQMYLTWGDAVGLQQWGMFFGGAWAAPQQLPYAQSYTANSVTFNPSWNQLVSIHRGTDGQIYWQRQTYGTGQWTNPARLGTLNTPAAGTPAVALTDNGSGEVAVWLSGGAVDPQTGSAPILLTQIFANGAWSGAWSVATGNVPTSHNLWLTAIQNRIYLINTFYTGYVYWKRSFQN